MSTEDDFYEDDESIEDLKRAWAEGEPGVTEGPRRLSLEQMRILRTGTTAFTSSHTWPEDGSDG